MQKPFPSLHNSRSHKDRKENACFYHADTKRCSFCTLNLYKHCLFSCSSNFKCQGDYCFQQGNVSRCTCQTASSSLWCQQMTLSIESENNTIYLWFCKASHCDCSVVCGRGWNVWVTGRKTDTQTFQKLCSTTVTFQFLSFSVLSTGFIRLSS